MCSGNVGTTVDGELFVACNICAFPVCRPCYEYKRKYGNQSCPQCQARYKRHKGSPPIHGYEVDVGNADDLATDFNYSSGNQDQKQKITERILSWHMAYERGEDVGASDYGKEVSHNHIPSPTNGHEVSSELSSSSPECLSMASPEAGVGKPMHPLLYAADVNQSPDIRFVDPAGEFGSPIFGNVAWKEDFDNWKANQEKNIVSMNTSHDTSEVSSSDMVMDDSLLRCPGACFQRGKPNKYQMLPIKIISAPS